MSPTVRQIRSLLLLAVLVICSRANAQAPTTNPMAEFYGSEGYPAWTDAIAWTNVIDMSGFADGANAFKQFENARDLLSSQGGGVLYYPAGAYDFSEAPMDGPNGRGLMLKSGVVIRGQAPLGDGAVVDGTLALGTKFTFDFQTKAGGQIPRDWGFVGMVPSGGETLKDINNIGIVWVEFTGATVFWGPDLEFGQTYGTANSWKGSIATDAWKDRVPDGTHYLDAFTGGTLGGSYNGAGAGRFVFGCQFNDAAPVNTAWDAGIKYDQPRSDPLAPFKFAGRISVYGSKVFVANNAIPKSDKCFTYQQQTCQIAGASNPNAISCGSIGCEVITAETVLFDYANTCGIDVNKSLLNPFNPRTGYFEDGIVITDNFVYNHGQVGFNAAGTWVTIKDNENRRDNLAPGDAVYPVGNDWVVTLDGFYRTLAGGPGCVSDNLSRAFDLAGKALWVDNNTYANTNAQPGNNGEGILCQAHGGTQLYSWAITHNRGTSYMGGYDVGQYGSLIAWNTTTGWVGNTKAGVNIDAAFVANDAGEGVQTTGDDVLTACPDGGLAKPTAVQAMVEDSDHVLIRWTDNAAGEIGFRVDRRASGGQWSSIAYRPRNSTGTQENEQAWADYLAPRGIPLQYRIVAIDCDDSETAASDPVDVTLPGGATTAGFVVQNRVDALAAQAWLSGTTLHIATGSQALQTQLFDLRGKSITQTTSKGPKAYDLRNLPAGMYLLRIVQNQTGETATLPVKLIH